MKMSHGSIWKEMMQLTPLCTGSLYEQYFPCGKKGCSCLDSENPKLHGPYYVWARRIDGRQVNRTLRPGIYVEKVKEGIVNYTRFKELCTELMRQNEEQILPTERGLNNEEGKKNFKRRSAKR